MPKELATLLHKLFATDQNYYAEQQADGTYRKKPGLVTSSLLERNIEQNGSIAVYQKNSDTTIQWICFDFDITKNNLEASRLEIAKQELVRCATRFCKSLEELEIPYLLEFSGNRGFHIWITFSEKISYRIGYDIQQAIIEKSDLDINKQLIAIDLFPSNITPTDGVGLGVKIPLSKHKKSGYYSLLLESTEETNSYATCDSLDENLINNQIRILRSHSSTTKSEIESKLGIFFDLSHDETFYPTRIKSIIVSDNGFTLENISDLWEKHTPLREIKRKIFEDRTLNNEERKLLVGLFGRATCKNRRDFNHFILHEIFKNTKNYDKARSQKAIQALSSFYFPSHEQIEKIAGIKFESPLTTEELLKACIPNYIKHEDATFELSSKDIEIVRTAELNYLFLNDEAQSKTIINELVSLDSTELLAYTRKILEEPKASRHYKHFRNEEKKTRTLITLRTPERITTSAILKQLIYFFDMQPNQNSHGYKPNKGFKGGHIFQPWLYLWIKFISNISTSIEDPSNGEYYIVKTDIKSFYDKIPHDNLKRLLLGGVNNRIDNRLKQIPENSADQYKKFIDALFSITETITEGNIGLPQGPAYARYLAEIYLDNIDSSFDERIKSGDVILYQRYVDDIFYIAQSEESAKGILQNLSKELSLLGLEINNEKTIVTKIKNFSDDFDNYRSQSKYAVDRASKNFADATDAQQNLAINEFMALVQSDSCEDDLAFIFSHLNGVPELDKWKRERIVPTINSGIGRGTLYKHLFTFALDSENNWSTLIEANYFTELQSEVLTSAFINALETNKSSRKELNTLFERIQEKLSITEMVAEHLTYLASAFETKIDITKIQPKLVIDCLSSAPSPETINLPPQTIPHLNTALNDIKSLAAFTRAMYPLCASSCISKEDLNNLASIFYSKLASDETNKNLSTDTPPEIETAATSLKFYYLLCLFSASSANASIELLKSMWKYCAHLYNLYGADPSNYRTPNWFDKINDIDIDERKAHFIISSIVDGNIYRGFEDNNKIFERFHNLLLIFITFRSNNLYDQSVEDALNTLKDKATFYKWLIDKDNVNLFPNSRAWFERNVVENSSIILKNGNQILFRKPTNGFHQSSNPGNEHNGYSEVIEDYNPENLHSVNDSLEGLTVKQRLSKLLSIISHCCNSENLPNIYCNERILNKETLVPFSNELIRSERLIFEAADGSVESFSNNQKNFISCYLRTSATRNSNDYFKIINEKYINNLSAEIDILEFLTQTKTQLENIECFETPFYLDAAISAALHLSLSELDTFRRIDKFVEQYHKFNPDVEDRHIYGVNEDLILSDENPILLLDAVEASLKAIPEQSIQSLAFYLDRDITHYKETLQKIAELEEFDGSALCLTKFRTAYHKILQTTEAISINGVNHKFSNVILLNPTNCEIQRFESRHTIILNSSEHVYYHQQDNLVYVIALQSSISKIYRTIEQRFKLFNKGGKIEKSYPDSAFDSKTILQLDKFNLAKEVISIHRGISKGDAESLLINWLKFLPKKFHQPLTTLISAHTVMSEEGIEKFTATVKALLEDPNSNPFLIKRVGDFNGTHRVLYIRDDIGRNVEDLSPINISPGATRATIITDNIITGSQIISAIKYYATGEGYKDSAKYYNLTTSEKDDVKLRLSNIRQLDICTILYTRKAIDNITKELNTIFDNKIDISIVSGIDIGDDALFGTTQKIGESAKTQIRAILKDKDAMRELLSHLNTTSSHKSLIKLNDEEINKLNLVARFKSLPKKCFKFLCLGLRHNTSCHPLVRVQELNEKS